MNLHLVARGKSHWVRNLALRDYLRANADARERYAQAKRYAVASGANRLLAYSTTLTACASTLELSGRPRGQRVASPLERLVRRHSESDQPAM
jgi:hypothetical protein